MKKFFIPLMVTAYLLTINAGAFQFFKANGTISINILSTSDIHGRLDGYDYNSGMNLPLGLDKISSIIKEEKKKDNDSIVIDAGDFNRGNPMTDLFNTAKSSEPNPVIDIMNRIGYDAATLGNHDMDYGKNIMFKIKSESRFPIVSANIYYNNKLMFKPYEIIERKGVKIGIIGLTTAGSLKYNAGDDIEGIEVKNVERQAQKYIGILRNEEKVDIVIALVHSGIEGLYKAPADETDVVKIANLPVKPDVIISGHSHMIISEMNINGAAVQSPGAMAEGIGKIQLFLKREGSKWNIAGTSAHFIPAASEEQDRELESCIEKYRDITLDYINTPIGNTKAEQTDSNDLINQVKQKDTGADVILDEGMKRVALNGQMLTAGDMYKIYGRENYILGVMTKGKNIKDYLNLRMARNPEAYNNLTGLRVAFGGDGMELYLGDQKINDDDDVKIALTGRQYKFDSTVKKSGIASGKIYYNSYLTFGMEGRVRERALNYIRNGII